MQAVSESWKENQKETITNEAFLKIEHIISDIDNNKSVVSINASDALNIISDISSLNKTRAINENKLITLEHNIWDLDGSMSAWDTQTKQRYVSNNICVDDTKFNVIQSIIFNLDKNYSCKIPGFTIVFSDSYQEYATDFNIVIYSDEEVKNFISITDNDKSIAYIPIENHLFTGNKIKLDIKKWKFPKHRARVNEITLGYKQEFQKENIMSYEHEQEVDFLGASLPKNSITFNIDNTNDLYNPENPQGINEFLEAKQIVNTYYGLNLENNIEWIKGGVFLLEEWNTPTNGYEVSFTARDIFGFMEETYSGRKRGSLYDIATDAFTQLKLPSNITCFFDSTLKDIVVDFSNDESDMTVSAIFQLISNASGCLLYQDRNGVCKLEPYSLVFNDYIISQDVMWEHPEYTMSKKLQGLSVNGGLNYTNNYLCSSGIGEVQTVDNNLCSQMVDIGISLEGYGVNNGKITNENGVGYGLSDAIPVESGRVYKIMHNGKNFSPLFTVYGFATDSENAANGQYIQTNTHNERYFDEGSFYWGYTEIVIPENSDIKYIRIELDEEKVNHITAFTSAENINISNTIANKATEVLKNRKTITGSYRTDPRLDAGDTVIVNSKYAKNIKLKVTRIKYSFEGTWHGEYEGDIS